MSDVRAAEARRQNRLANEALEGAARHREQRDTLVRALRRDDPTLWTYAALARAVGVSEELIAYTIRRNPQ